MRRGTTPTLEITVNGYSDLANLTRIIVTFKQNHVIINRNAVVTNGRLVVSLTQEQTLSLEEGKVKVQMKAKTIDGNVIASDWIEVDVKDILNEVIM